MKPVEKGRPQVQGVCRALREVTSSPNLSFLPC